MLMAYIVLAALDETSQAGEHIHYQSNIREKLLCINTYIYFWPALLFAS